MIHDDEIDIQMKKETDSRCIGVGTGGGVFGGSAGYRVSLNI